MSSSFSTTDVAENTPAPHVRIESLDPPSRPYTATDHAPGISDSTRTSFTQIDQDEDRFQPSNPDDPSPIVALPTMSEQEPQPEIPQVPQTPLTFLLISGRRRTMNFAPEYTIGRVKELIWNAWPEDWKDDRPPAPSYLRILYLGKMLQDDETLNRLKLPTTLSTLTPTIVHLSIRPYAPPNEQDGFKKKRGRGRSGDSVSAVSGPLGDEEAAAGGAGCCGCVIC